MSNQTENNLEANQPNSQEEVKPLFSGTDSQGKERLFTDVDDVQKSWQSSQDFIKNTVQEKQSLEEQVQELKAQLNQSLKLEDALAKLQTKEEPTVNTDTSTPNETTPQLDIEQLKAELLSAVESKQTESALATQHSNNQQESIEAAKAVYGESYETKLREQAQALGMSDADIIQEAQTNPVKFKTLFGLNRTSTHNSMPSSSYTIPPESKEVELKFGGFSQSQKVGNHYSNLEAIAKKHGIKLQGN